MHAVLSLAMAFLSDPTQEPIAVTRYFPLEAGRTWTYSQENFPSSEREVEVIGAEGNDSWRVRFDAAEVIIRELSPSDLDIEVPEEGFVTYYRFAEPSWLHRDFQGCDDNRQMTVGVETLTIETPAGTFTDCLQIQYGDPVCSDAGTEVEWWAPDVGRVKWIEQSIAGPRTFLLASTGIPGPALFRRGEADSDGQVTLGDAIYVLNWLFLGGQEPSCLDAADSNDDADITIADPIALLGYLFLGTAAPPAPGPTTCGEDPTEDAYTECRASGCVPE